MDSHWTKLHYDKTSARGGNWDCKANYNNMTANSWFLHDVIPLGGGADIDSVCEQFRKVDIDNETIAKDIIANDTKPEFDQLKSEYRQAIKFSLSYYLTSNLVDFEGLLNANLVPYPIPKDSKLFFTWIWEVLFPGENYLMEGYESVRSSNVLSEYKDFRKIYGGIPH